MTRIAPEFKKIAQTVLADKISWRNFKHALHELKAGGQEARNKAPNKAGIHQLD